MRTTKTSSGFGDGGDPPKYNWDWHKEQEKYKKTYGENEVESDTQRFIENVINKWNEEISKSKDESKQQADNIASSLEATWKKIDLNIEKLRSLNQDYDTVNQQINKIDKNVKKSSEQINKTIESHTNEVNSTFNAINSKLDNFIKTNNENIEKLASAFDAKIEKQAKELKSELNDIKNETIKEVQESINNLSNDIDSSTKYK